jgi:hypothetical protein
LELDETPSVHGLMRRNLVIAAALLIMLVVGFFGGLYYVFLTTRPSPLGIGWSGLVVNYIIVNGPAINGGGYPSYCCPDCSTWNGFGANRINVLNQQNPPKASCTFKINANTSGYLLLNVFNTDADFDYATHFVTSSTDPTITYVSLPDCSSACIINATTSQWFKFGFVAGPTHDSAEEVTLYVTVIGY